MTRICQIDGDFPHNRNTVMLRNEPFFTDRGRNGLFRDIFGTQDLMDELDNGLIDFALIFTEFDQEKYRSIQLPVADRFGVLMRRDDPLASKPEIQMTELAEVPLMISRASQSYWENIAKNRNLNKIGRASCRERV